VISLAKSAKGTDANGYRQEFINLVQSAGSLTVKK
jgi:Ca-activated chloride channel family protein